MGAVSINDVAYKALPVDSRAAPAPIDPSSTSFSPSHLLSPFIQQSKKQRLTRWKLVNKTFFISGHAVCPSSSWIPWLLETMKMRKV